MPIRPRLCQEAANPIRLPSPQNLWITDDVLADAFARYARVSPGAKRFGSNVPGPLEAQRRLAKRRMMGLAHHAIGAGPGVDIGALFGTGGPKLGKLEWQAPKRNVKLKKKSATKASLLDDLLGSRKKPHTRDALSSDSGQTQMLDTRMDFILGALPYVDVKEMENLAHQVQTQDLDHVRFSKEAFAALIESGRPWKSTTEFLYNPQLNNPDAHNMTTIISHVLQNAPSADSDLDILGDVVESCLRIRLVSDAELLKILPQLLGTESDGGSGSDLPGVVTFSFSTATGEDADGSVVRREQFLQSVWSGLTACRIKTISRTVAEMIYGLLPPQSSLRLQLLRHLWPVKLEADAPLDACVAEWAVQAADTSSNTLMNHDVLAKIIEDTVTHHSQSQVFLQATERLLRMARIRDWPDEARLRIYNGWLITVWRHVDRPQSTATGWRDNFYFDILEVFAAGGVSLLDLVEFLKLLAPQKLICEALIRTWLPKLSHPMVFDDMKAMSQSYQDIYCWSNVLDDFRYLGLRSEEAELAPAHSFALVWIASSRHLQLNKKHQALLIHLADRLYGPEMLSEILKMVRSAKIKLFPQPIAPIIERESAAGNGQIAMALFKRRIVWTAEFNDFYRVLIHDGLHSIDIFWALNRMDPKFYVSTTYRKDLKNNMSDLKIEILHKMADLFSRRETDDCRLRYRNVYICYRYLSDRQAPIGPLLSRALVRAGITCYLREELAVPQTQVKWIINMVEKLEGSEVANKMDELVFEWMQDVYALHNERGLHRATREEMEEGMPRERPSGWIVKRSWFANSFYDRAEEIESLPLGVKPAEEKVEEESSAGLPRVEKQETGCIKRRVRRSTSRAKLMRTCKTRRATARKEKVEDAVPGNAKGPPILYVKSLKLRMWPGEDLRDKRPEAHWRRGQVSRRNGDKELLRDSTDGRGEAELECDEEKGC